MHVYGDASVCPDAAIFSVCSAASGLDEPQRRMSEFPLEAD